MSIIILQQIYFVLHIFDSGIIVALNYYLFIVKLRVSFYKLFVNVLLEWVRVVMKHGIYSTRGNCSYLAYS